MKFTCYVKPNAVKSEIIFFDKKVIKVNIKSAAEKGKANIELIKFLKKELKLRLRIVTGLTSRKKVLETIN